MHEPEGRDSTIITGVLVDAEPVEGADLTPPAEPRPQR